MVNAPFHIIVNFSNICTMYTISPHHSPVSRQTIDDDISSVAFTAKSMGFHFKSEGGYKATISIQKHG